MTFKDALHFAVLRVLEPVGFVVNPGPWRSFARITNRSRQFVDFVDWKDESSVVVDLQEESDGHRHVSLESFLGRGKYYYGDTTTDFDNAINAIVFDLESYGLPWLNGAVVATEAMVKRQLAVSAAMFNERVGKARAAFKRGDFSAACELYAEASAHSELSELDTKFHDKARKMASRGGSP